MTRRLPDPQELLAGRSTADAATLCALIRDVNPTGAGYSRAETTRRYALKSRLQSLLIRAHGEVLVVARDDRSRDEGIVTLRTLAGADAGHARLDALDDDARAWVQRRLDEGAASESAVRPAATTRRAGGLATRPSIAPVPLAEARRALAEYDFERARELLGHLACEERPDGHTAAGLLADLLVNQLALYDVALTLAHGWSAPACADPAIRAALARAAAEVGDAEAAAMWLKGADERESLEVIRTLAERACAARQLEEAESWLVHIRSMAPTYATLPTLVNSVAALRRDLAAPLERELRARLDANEIDSTDAAAKALRAIEPSNALLRELTERLVRGRREATAAEAVTRAELLAESRRSREALEALAVLDLHGVSEPLRARVATLRKRIEAEAEETSQREAARRVLDALAGGRLAFALTGYAALPVRARAWVRAVDAREELAWIDQLREAARPDEVSAAVVALASARAGLRGERPALALARLESHRNLLERIAAGAEAFLELRRRIAEEARGTAEQRLARAKGALEDDRLADARAELAATLADRELVDDALRDAARTALSALEARERRLASLRAVDAAARLGDPLAARAALEALQSRLTADDERDACARSLRETEARIVATFRVEMSVGPGPAGELWPFVAEACDDEAPSFVASPDGARAFVSTSFADWLFVHELDLQTGNVIARASLRTPSAMGQVRRQVLAEGVLWVAGHEGAVIGLRMGEPAAAPEPPAQANHGGFEWLPVAWHSAREAPGEMVDGVTLVGRGATVWAEVRRENDSRTTVTGIASGEHRELDSLYPLGVLDGRASPAIVCNCFRDGSVNLCSPTGAVIRKLSAPASEGLIVASAAADPRGGEGVALLAHDPESERDAELWVGTGALPDPSAARWTIPGLDPTRCHVLVTMASTRSFAVLTSFGEQRTWYRGGEGVELTREVVSLEAVVIQDLAARRAWTLSSHTRGVACCALEDGLPRELVGREGATSAARRALGPTAPRPLLRCKWLRGPVRAHALALMAARGARQGDNKRLPYFRKLAAQAPADGEHAAAVLSAADAVLSTAELDELALELATRHPEVPVIRLFEADAHLGARSFALARTALEAAAGMTPEAEQHRHHLRALLELQAGDLDAARSALRAAEQLEGECKFDGLGVLLAELEAGPGPENGASPSALSTLIRLVRTADTRLASGDAAGAVELLDADIVWFAEEIQSRARLSEARLALDAPSALERIRKRVALASFVCALGEKPALQRRLPLGTDAWDDARIGGVARRAREWLDRP